MIELDLDSYVKGIKKYFGPGNEEYANSFYNDVEQMLSTWYVNVVGKMDMSMWDSFDDFKDHLRNTYELRVLKVRIVQILDTYTCDQKSSTTISVNNWIWYWINNVVYDRFINDREEMFDDS